MFQAYFEDKEKGGLFHAMSEDWSKVISTEKRAEEQFNAARMHVIGAMITHDPESIKDAGEAVDEVIGRFEDTKNGGYFLAADKDWNITKREKNLGETSEIFGVLMHLYEVSMNDGHLLKAMDFMDVILEKAWDKEKKSAWTISMGNPGSSSRRMDSTASAEKSTAVTSNPLWANRRASCPCPAQSTSSLPGSRIPRSISRRNSGVGPPRSQWKLLDLYRVSQKPEEFASIIDINNTINDCLMV